MRWLFLVGVFTQFHEGADGRFGVEEGDVEPFGALAGGLVDQAAAFFLSLGESVGHAVLDREGDMLDASAAAVVGDEFRDGAFGSGAFEQLDFCLSDFEEGGLYFLVSYFFDGKTFKAENVLVEGDSLLQGGDCDPDLCIYRIVSYCEVGC